MMAATIHSLWESDDKSPLILPCSVPLVDTRVSAELAGKLPEYWQPVIDADIDGPGHVQHKSTKRSHTSALHATRRVARTIFFEQHQTLARQTGVSRSNGSGWGQRSQARSSEGSLTL